MADDSRRRGLGRGLSALLGDENADYASLDRLRESKSVPIEFLHPGKQQPRKHFDRDSIAALAQSIREKGVLQPLLVRRHPVQANAYEIVAGERRWRAAQQAEIREVPVVIKDLTDAEALELALVENIQRDDLTAIEEAEGYRRLMDEFSYTQEALATGLGKSRSHVANTLRLLSLPPTVRTMVNEGALSAGHARALINAGDVERLAVDVARRGLNVRQTERLVRQARGAPEGRRGRRSSGDLSAGAGEDPNTAALERDLTALLGLKVQIKLRGEGGDLTIRYETLEQLDDLLQRMTHGPDHRH